MTSRHRCPSQSSTPMSTNGTEQKKSNKIADIVKFVLFLGIGVFFIYWFLLKLDQSQRRAIWQSFCKADYLWVAAAMACSLFSHWVRALRWNLLYAPIGYHPKTTNTFGSVMIAYLANLAFPRLGEVARCATMHTSEKIPLEKSIGTVFTERIVDVFAFALVILLGFLVMFDQAKDWIYDTLSQKFSALPSTTTIVVALAGLAVAAFLFFRFFYRKLLRFPFVKKIDKLFRGCIDGLRSIFHLGKRKSCLFIFYSAIIYFLYILGGWIIFKTLPETSHLGLRAAYVVYLFGSVGMLISQGGLGAYPVLVWQGLAIYGIGKETALASGWLLWSSQQIVVLVVGLAFTLYFSLAKKKEIS